MLQEAWQLSVAATDWAELHRQRPQMTDADLADELGRTAVAQAASMCYGPQSAQQIPKWSRYVHLNLTSRAALVSRIFPTADCTCNRGDFVWQSTIVLTRGLLS